MSAAAIASVAFEPSQRRGPAYRLAGGSVEHVRDEFGEADDREAFDAMMAEHARRVASATAFVMFQCAVIAMEPDAELRASVVGPSALAEGDLRVTDADIVQYAEGALRRLLGDQAEGADMGDVAFAISAMGDPAYGPGDSFVEAAGFLADGILQAIAEGIAEKAGLTGVVTEELSQSVGPDLRLTLAALGIAGSGGAS